MRQQESAAGICSQHLRVVFREIQEAETVWDWGVEWRWEGMERKELLVGF